MEILKNGVNEQESQKILKSDITKIVTGEDAFSLFSDAEFQKQWDLLYTGCSWATAFQSRIFVVSWFRIFRKEYYPIVVISESDEGELTGILPLATRQESLNKGKRLKIFGAGEFEAEYQVWISREDNRDLFIRSAFQQLMEEFPGCNILFRFIPDGSVLDWIENDPLWKKRLVVQPFRRPLMEINSPEIHGLLKLQRQFKTKYNRLNRLGKVRFERVWEVEEFKVILEELMLQFDFRQGAMFNKNQFRDNPKKGELLFDLFKQGLLHVTILKVDDEIIASMAAIYDKKWVHLQGLNSHSPFYSRFSPGILHFYLLGQKLVEEQADVFDLTPGGDLYKERWATTHDTVYALTLTSDPKYFVKRQLKRITYDWLIKAGYRPMTVELQIKKKLYLFKRKGIRGLLKTTSNNDRLEVYKTGLSQNEVSPLPVKKNKVRDLLDYEGSQAQLTRWEFTERAMADFGEGKNVYSYSDGDQLFACIWEGNRPESNIAAPGFVFPDNAVFLSNLYCHADFSLQAERFMHSVIAKVTQGNAQCAVFVQVAGADKVGVETLEKLGAEKIV